MQLFLLLSCCVVFCSAEVVTKSVTAIYELPRDCDSLKKLEGSQNVAAIVVRGLYNSTSSCSFAITTAKRQISLQVTKFLNPFCFGNLSYSDVTFNDGAYDVHHSGCVRDAKDFAPYSSRKQIHVQVNVVRNGSRAGSSIFSFELVFTFFRTYQTACDTLRCSKSRWCIDASLRCDGIHNCEDGSDETAPECNVPASSGVSALLGEYITYLIAAMLGLLLISVTIGIGLYCRRHRRIVQAHRTRIREIRRRTELARHAASNCADDTNNGRSSRSRNADAEELVEPFLAPPDYRTVMLGEHIELAEETPPPTYVEALEITKLSTEKKQVDPNVQRVEPSNCQAFDSPSTSSCRIAETTSPVITITTESQSQPIESNNCEQPLHAAEEEPVTAISPPDSDES